MPVNLNLADGVPVAGVRLASVAAGIKRDGSTDLVLIALPEGSTTAAVFTQSHFAAAPVLLSRQHLASSGGAVRALLVNSGNANAGTGEPGLAMARGHAQAVAQALEVPLDAVLPFSTGVIGQALPDVRLRGGIEAAAALIRADAEGGDGAGEGIHDGPAWQRAARGIMTTDTQPKLTSRSLEVAGTLVTLTGFAKGAGMIEPDMATMLAYVFTDAAIDAASLDRALRGAVATSFNAITVDSDTSTNDSLVLCATGRGAALGPDHADWQAFVDALSALCLDLAQAIVRDAEGATKFITVRVAGGDSVAECRSVARAIANSPLVKTALFASDANVGRLLMAIGKAQVPEPANPVLSVRLDANRIDVRIGDVLAFAAGGVAAGYTEERGAAVFAREEILIEVALGRGEAVFEVYTSDLSHDYVRINADYRS